MAETYDVGTRAWQPDATEGWVASEVIKKDVQGSKVILEFKLESGEVRLIPDRASWRREEDAKAAMEALSRIAKLTESSTPCRQKPSRLPQKLLQRAAIPRCHH